MKISAGKYKGRNLIPPTFKGIRPTADKVREAIFNVIGEAVLNSETLDLFAGTGALGIDALSRGASFVVFVDSSHKACSLIRKNLKKLGINSSYEVLQIECEKAVKKLHAAGRLFDIIFIDPPYFESELEGILALIGSLSILKKNGLVVAEHSSRKKAPLSAGGITSFKTKRYGDTSVTYYKFT